MILEILAGIFLARFVYRWLMDKLFPAPLVSSAGKYVVITGCDTGFGRLLAPVLDKAGYNVIASCLTSDGVNSLKAELSNKALVVQLDVTKQDSLDRFVDTVKRTTDNLWGLVNNAGIVSGSWIDWSSMADYRRVMEVNFFGGVALTKAFIPLLQNAKGRVVNVTSVAGFLAAPGMSCYVASKFAFDSFSLCLRRELAQSGVTVSIISPAFMKTPIVSGAVDVNRRAYDNLPAEIKERYGQDYLEAYIAFISKNTEKQEDPILVVRDIAHAIGSTKPKGRYYSGWASTTFFRTMGILPESWVDWLMVARQRAIKVLPRFMRKQAGGADKESKSA